MEWRDCKNILVVRLDNMGDLLMSAPAITALKETFGCSISVLTSSMANAIAHHIPVIDDVIVYDVPWVKAGGNITYEHFTQIINTLQSRNFDAAIIFTVFSQNPLPTALLLTLAGIPKRLGYCRENPYLLLTDWVSDEEPYSFVRHQVRRDLDLVKAIGAHTTNENITIRIPENLEQAVKEKLVTAGIDCDRPWLILHPCVSEKKREYPEALWTETGRKIIRELNYQVVITGGATEKTVAGTIARGIGENACSVAGLFSLEELIVLLKLSPLLISVNTGTIHLAAAVQTKTIVLYALTNPQHLPWKTTGKVLPFSVPRHLQSRNEVLKFLKRNYFNGHDLMAKPDSIVEAASHLLNSQKDSFFPELVSLNDLAFDHGINNTLNFRLP